MSVRWVVARSLIGTRRSLDGSLLRGAHIFIPQEELDLSASFSRPARTAAARTMSPKDLE